MHRSHGRGPLDRLSHGLAHAVQHIVDAEDFATQDGPLQRLDPRVKLAAVLALVVVAVASRSLIVLAAMAAIAVTLVIVSGLPVARLFRPVWLGVLAFTGLIALPALVLVPGDVLIRVPGLGWPVSLQGTRSAAFLIARSELSTTLGLLLVLTTRWAHLLKALRGFGVPVIIVAILGMTTRYVLLLLDLAHQMFEARRSRHVGPLAPRDGRRIATATAGVLLLRSLEMSGEVHLAMVARGYRGEPRTLDDFALTPRDRLALAALVGIAASAFTIGLWSSLP